MAVSPHEEQEVILDMEVLEGTFIVQAVENVNGNERILGSATRTTADVEGEGSANNHLLRMSILPASSQISLRLNSPLIGSKTTNGLQPGDPGYVEMTCCHNAVKLKKVTVKVKYLDQEQISVTLCDSTADRYRFGYNGQEKVNEIAGIGNHNTAQFGEFDTRLGRRWNTDPKSGLMPNESPYAVNHGNPIAYKDPKGDFGFIGAAIGAGIGGLASLTTSVINDGWGSLKDGKTWAKAGVNATAGAIVGATGGLGAGLVATATTSFGVSLAEDAIDGKELNIKKATASSVANTVLFGAGKFGADKLSKAVTKHWWRRGNTNAFMRHLGNAPGTNVGQVIDRASDVIGVGLGLSMDNFFPDKEQMPTIELEGVTIYAEKNEEGNYKASPDSIESASQEMQQQQQRAVEEYNKSQDNSGNKE